MSRGDFDGRPAAPTENIFSRPDHATRPQERGKPLSSITNKWVCKNISKNKEGLCEIKEKKAMNTYILGPFYILNIL